MMIEENAEHHVVDKIVRYLPSEDKFLVRWSGYGPEEDTMEPPEYLKWNTKVQFFKRTRKSITQHYTSTDEPKTRRKLALKVRENCWKHKS